MKLVVGVMPTRGRKEWAAQAVQCFISQMYPLKTLLILDDEDDPSFPVWPFEADSIIYVRTKENLNIPQKRNRLTQMAPEASVLMHFDSDDYSHPDRMSSQMHLMRESQKPFVGFHSVLFYAEQSKQLYKYRGVPNYVVGTSFCFTREWGIAHPFKESKHKASDHLLWQTAVKDSSNFVTVDGGNLIVARIHDGNTCEKRLAAEFVPQPIEMLPEGFPA